MISLDQSRKKLFRIKFKLYLKTTVIIWAVIAGEILELMLLEVTLDIELDTF